MLSLFNQKKQYYNICRKELISQKREKEPKPTVLEKEWQHPVVERFFLAGEQRVEKN